MTFSEKLKELRLDKGLRLKDVALALSIPLRTYAHYEQGDREPPLDLLRDMCKFFDVSADYLIGLVDEY